MSDDQKVRPRPKRPPRRRTYLKEWRKHRGLTQERAAERLGLEQSTLSRLERGQLPYNQDFLEAAAKAYSCEPQDLLMRNPLDEDAVWSIADNLKTATPEQRSLVRDLIDTVIKRKAG